MGALQRRAGRAFTLIELMIVVAIVGILAVLAIYGVRKYLANAKTAEATNALGRLANAASTEFENERMAGSVLTPGNSSSLSRALCKSASKSVPASAGAIAGKKYQSADSEWNVDFAGGSGFSCLEFTIDQPQYYMYSYAATVAGAIGDNYTATANGDLNGDGILSTFQITGAVNSAFVLNTAPNLITTNPEE